jgi:1-acyl-sn-glycerol-3-phosphate acyltransferase
MQNIVIDKPYRFVPPYPGRFWAGLIRFWLPTYLRRVWGIEASEVRGAEHLKQSLQAGHGVLLTPTHSRPCDPMVMGLLSIRAGRPFFCMASWHLFMQGRFQPWLMRRLGAFSVYREGLDREALKAATAILVGAVRPLIIFPEGIVTRTNDRLGTLMDGTAFIARSAARLRARAAPPRQVVVHPVAIKYFFLGDLEKSVGPVLDAIEARLGWRPQRPLPLAARIGKLGDALLSLKEIEYLGRAQPGTIHERLAGLIDRVVMPLEQEWLGGHREPAVMERVKRLRSAIVPDMAGGGITEEERARRWGQLADIYLAQQLACYPPDYLRVQPTPERLLETVERFEEDLTDEARVHRPLRVVIQVGEPLEVSPTRERGGADPLMRNLEERLQGMLDLLAAESATLPPARLEPDSA